MACLVCLLLIAVLDDIKSWKISNHLILIGILAGIIYDIYEYGWTGISIWLPGVILPIILLFPLFLIKVLGAGDIKLFSVIGSFYGASYVLQSIAAAFILGAVMSLIYLIKNKLLLKRFFYLFHYIQSIITNFTVARESAKTDCNNENISCHKIIEPYHNLKIHGYEGAIHFSIAVLGGFLLQILHNYIG